MLSKDMDLTFVTHRGILSLSRKVPLNCSIFSAEKGKFVHPFIESGGAMGFAAWLEIFRKKINSCVGSWLKTCFLI